MNASSLLGRPQAPRKVFWDDPYAVVHDTTVVSVSGADVTVASTIFFAFSGGQESDSGTIAGQPVVAARKDGLDIVYTLPAGHGLAPGQPVRIEIDGARRRRLMRLHFAAELVLELFCKSHPGIEKVGAHIGEEKARIDFAFAQNVAPLLERIAEQANAIIEANLAIECAFDDEASERRYWEIAGFSRVPCGGTHVRRTGEVGAIRLKRSNIGRGRERVEIHLDA